ncbi:MAG TPA: hypothetical protein VMC08_02935 [Bacteroidales bacterium]|nr:hypothetical protein [Bacteroidales bacterium]
MENRFERILSYVLHPLFVPTYIMGLLISLPYFVASRLPVLSKLILAGTVVTMTAFIPLIFMAFMHRRKIIRTFFLETREERIYPLLTVAVSYYITYYILKGYPVSALFSYYMLGSTFLAVLSLIISFYSKISLHMIGIGGFLGLTLGMMLNFGFNLFWPVVILVALSGLLAYARLKVGSHKPFEVYSGFLLGAGVMFILFFFI